MTMASPGAAPDVGARRKCSQRLPERRPPASKAPDSSVPSGVGVDHSAQGNKRRRFRTDDIVPRRERVERSPRSACGRAARSTPVPVAMRSQGKRREMHTFRCESQPAVVDAKEHMMSTTSSSTSAARSILTIDEAAAYLAIPKATLYTWRTRRPGLRPAGDRVRRLSAISTLPSGRMGCRPSGVPRRRPTGRGASRHVDERRCRLADRFERREPTTG